MPLHSENSGIAIPILSDDRGTAVTAEVLLVGAVAVFGLLAALAAVRDSVVSELSDIGGSVQESVQAYTLNGVIGSSSATEGMDYQDFLDVADDSEDLAGAADNGIVFDVAPSGEGFAVSTESLIAQLLFDGNAGDSSDLGGDNSGVLRNGASISDGQLVLDGINDFVTINNSSDINVGGPFPERTIHVEFTPNDVTSRQVIFEEGGTIRGLVIYIDNGLLYLGGYNIPETGYSPTYVSAPIVAGQMISASIVLDAGPTVAPNGFSGYLNGSLIGRTDASQLYSHGGGIGVGGINGWTVFHDGSQSSGAYFNGSVEGLSIYNRVLTDAEIGGL